MSCLLPPAWLASADEICHSVVPPPIISHPHTLPQKTLEFPHNADERKQFTHSSTMSTNNQQQQRQRSQRYANGGGTVSSVHTATEEPATLRLRGESQATDTESSQEQSASRRVRWDESVVNNEGMGKKSSKGKWKIWTTRWPFFFSLLERPSSLIKAVPTPPLVCCIYHRPRALDESSSESSDSESSSDDSDIDDNMRAARRLNRRRRENCEHDDTSCPGHSHDIKRAGKKPSPNAYERVSKSNRKHTTHTKMAWIFYKKRGGKMHK